MEMSQVRYFVALCQARSFTRAAHRCGISQPSLTQAIKALEAELGGRLFHRNRHGTELTEFGLRVEACFAEMWRNVVEIRRLCPASAARDRKTSAMMNGDIELQNGKSASAELKLPSQPQTD